MSDDKLPDEDYLKLVRNAKSELDTLRKYPTRRPAQQKDQEPFNSNTTIAESKSAPDMQILEEPLAGGGTTEEATHPFKLKTADDDREKWTIFPTGSSITEGTLGDNLVIGGLEDERIGLGYVHIQVGILDGAITGASVVVEDERMDELEFDPTDASVQTAANLFVGVVLFENNFTFKQAIRSAQIIERMFYNGVLCWGFVPHPSHPASLLQ